MADRIQFRRDTAARWSQYNPILLEGEIGVVTDNPNQYKIGDGSSAWNSLPFRGFDGTVVQETGNAEDAVMSQKAVTDNIHKYSSYGSDFAISGGYHPIIHCFKNTHIFDPKGVNGYRIQVAGYNSSSKGIAFYFIDANEVDVTTENAYTYNQTSELAPTGIIHYDFTSKGIRFCFDFDWDCFNDVVGNIFNISQHLEIKMIIFSDTDIESLSSIKNLLYSKGFSIHGDITINHLHIWLCIVNLKIYDKNGPSEFKINQQGLSSSTGNALFYYQRISDSALVEYNLSNPVTTGVQHYEFVSNGVRVELDFNWDIYNQYFTNRFGNIIEDDYLSFTSSPIEEVNEYFLTKGFSTVSSFSTSNIRLTKVISNFKAWYYGLAGETDLKYQFKQHGILNNKTGIIFYYQRYGAEGNNEIVEYQIPYVEENCTGIRHYCLEDKTIKVEFDWDWDVYKELFPTDLYRMTTDLPLVFPVSKIEVESDSSENYSLGNKITVKSGSKVMLVGASFASSLNGWFELVCSKMGITAVNRAIGGQNIINNVAERMLDADETMPHGSLFYVDGKDIFEEVEAFVLMMTHNNDVYLSDEAYQSNTLEYYKENGVGTDRAAAFDYVIKQYKQWCAEYTVSQHRTSAGQEIDDVIGTKECQILICSNWNCGRATYNNSSKKLAERFGLSYCDFTANDNLGANHLITATINTDTSLSPVKGQYHPSVLYAHFDSYYQGAWAGKTEVIGGITYGWHPQGRSTTYDYGNPQESDGYYYPDIQYILAGIFKSCVEII